MAAKGPQGLQVKQPPWCHTNIYDILCFIAQLVLNDNTN